MLIRTEQIYEIHNNLNSQFKFMSAVFLKKKRDAYHFVVFFLKVFKRNYLRKEKTTQQT